MPPVWSFEWCDSMLGVGGVSGSENEQHKKRASCWSQDTTTNLGLWKGRLDLGVVEIALLSGRTLMDQSSACNKPATGTFPVFTHGAREMLQLGLVALASHLSLLAVWCSPASVLWGTWKAGWPRACWQCPCKPHPASSWPPPGHLCTVQYHGYTVLRRNSFTRQPCDPILARYWGKSRAQSQTGGCRANAKGNKESKFCEQTQWLYQTKHRSGRCLCTQSVVTICHWAIW